MRDGMLGFIAYMLLLLVSVPGTPLSFISLIFLPLPSLVFTAKHTRKAGIVFVGVLAACSLAFGLFWVLSTIVAAGAGWAMGQFHHSGRRSISGTLTAGTVVLLAGLVLMLSLVSALTDFQLASALEREWANTVDVYEEVFEGPLAPYADEMKAAGEMMLSLLPAGFILLAGGTSLVNHAVGRRVLARLDVPTAKLPPFKEWHFPRSVLAWYIVSVVILLLNDAGSYWYSVALTANWLLSLLFVVQALSLLTAWTDRALSGTALSTMWLAVFLLPLAVIMILFLYIPLTFLGMLDIGFRFRERMKRS